MQNEEANQLRKMWGDKKCDHPNFSKEYYLGAQTGDYICVQCGRSFFSEQVKEIEKERSDSLEDSN